MGIYSGGYGINFAGDGLPGWCDQVNIVIFPTFRSNQFSYFGSFTDCVEAHLLHDAVVEVLTRKLGDGSHGTIHKTLYLF